MSKVLIVDDSSLMRAVLINFVKKEGNYTILEGKDGNEAFAIYEKERPDLVFMDIVMNPGLDGLSALEKIMKKYPLAKVVMVTSLKEKDQVDKATSLGAKGYIMKPFSREQIIEALKKNTGV